METICRPLQKANTRAVNNVPLKNTLLTLFIVLIKDF